MSLGLCSDTFAFCEFICDSINRARARQIIHYKIALYICKRAIYICKIYRVFVTHGRRTNPKHRDNTTHARFGSHFLGSHVAHTHTHKLSLCLFLSLSFSLTRAQACARSLSLGLMSDTSDIYKACCCPMPEKQQGKQKRKGEKRESCASASAHRRTPPSSAFHIDVQINICMHVYVNI